MIYRISIERDRFFVEGHHKSIEVSEDFLKEKLEDWRFKKLLKDGSVTKRDDEWKFPEFPKVDKNDVETIKSVKTEKWYFGKNDEYMLITSPSNPGVYELYKHNKKGYYNMIQHVFNFLNVGVIIDEYRALEKYQKKLRWTAYDIPDKTIPDDSDI